MLLEKFCVIEDKKIIINSYTDKPTNLKIKTNLILKKNEKNENLNRYFYNNFRNGFL